VENADLINNVNSEEHGHEQQVGETKTQEMESSSGNETETHMSKLHQGVLSEQLLESHQKDL